MSDHSKKQINFRKLLKYSLPKTVWNVLYQLLKMPLLDKVFLTHFSSFGHTFSFRFQFFEHNSPCENV